MLSLNFVLQLTQKIMITEISTLMPVGIHNKSTGPTKIQMHAYIT